MNEVVFVGTSDAFGAGGRPVGPPLPLLRQDLFDGRPGCHGLVQNRIESVRPGRFKNLHRGRIEPIDSVRLTPSASEDTSAEIRVRLGPCSRS